MESAAIIRPSERQSRWYRLWTDPNDAPECTIVEMLKYTPGPSNGQHQFWLAMYLGGESHLAFWSACHAKEFLLRRDQKNAGQVAPWGNSNSQQKLEWANRLVAPVQPVSKLFRVWQGCNAEGREALLEWVKGGLATGAPRKGAEILRWRTGEDEE